jgi:hypothetical protein
MLLNYLKVYGGLATRLETKIHLAMKSFVTYTFHLIFVSVIKSRRMRCVTHEGNNTCNKISLLKTSAEEIMYVGVGIDGRIILK